MQQFLPKILFFFLLALWGAVIPAAAQPARLHGDATLGMTGYHAEEAGTEVDKVSSMTQRYSLSLDKIGTLGDTRLGSYVFMVGYEFNVLDTDRVKQGERDESIAKIETGKLLYNFRTVIAPGGLPFRLTLFAADTKSTVFVAQSFSSLRVGNQNQGNNEGHLLDADIPYDLSNGKRQTLGGTLLLGIRNGSYLGMYRDVLSQMPRLLIDYKQEVVEDTHSTFSPTHYRNRDLAFISLNKKDNWVHVRLREFTDFLNSENDTQTAQTMIGTIDHNLQRQWINLTNWLKISGDLSLTVQKEKYWTTPHETYQTNLLTTFRKQSLSGNIFSNFTRETDGNSENLNAELPFYLSVERDRNTLFRTRFLATASNSSRMENGTTDTSLSQRHYNDFFLDLEADLNRTRPIVIKPKISFENYSKDDNLSGVALRLGSELASNKVRPKGVNWVAGYFFTAMQSKSDSDSSTFYQNDVYGSIHKDINSTLQIGGSSKLAIGTGENNGSFKIPTMSSRLVSGGRGDGYVNSDGLKSNGTLNLYLEHFKREVGNRLELNFDFYSADGEAIKKGSLKHTLGYQHLAHKLDWSSVINAGEEIDNARSVSLDYITAESGSNDKSFRTNWSSQSTYRYEPGRSAALTLKGAVSGEQQALSYNLSEEIAYRIYTTNGIIRRIAEFTEVLTYEADNQSVDGRDSVIRGAFSASYLPKKYLYGKIGSEVVAYPGSNGLQQTNTAEVGVGYEKLKIFASYKRGQKNRESADLPEVKEERWDLNVKKIF